MIKIEIKVESLNHKSFGPYGKILGPSENKPTFSGDEFDLWFGIDNVESDKDIAQLCWFEVKKKRPFICDKVERHLKCSETIIPMSGQSIIIVGLSKNDADDTDSLDLKTIKAFYLGGSRGINLKLGVWHWIPYPVSDEAHFVLILREGTDKDDLEIMDLNEEFDLSIKFVLEK